MNMKYNILDHIQLDHKHNKRKFPKIFTKNNLSYFEI